MISARPIVFGAICILLAGCGEDRSGSSGIDSFGLIEAPSDRPVILSAIEKANSVLASDDIVFTAGWEKPVRLNTIPVYTVKSGLASQEIMGIFEECRCVLVQAAALERWLSAKQGGSSALLTLDERPLFAYMLLHEAGHFNAMREAAKNGATEPPERDADSKGTESDADTFAAAAIRLAMTQSGERGLSGGEIGMLLAQLSWNLSAHRLLDDFGGTVLKKPSLFQDNGLSHPNLEWRILVVNNLISQTEASHKLLTDFEDARNKPGTGILWQKSE